MAKQNRDSSSLYLLQTAFCYIRYRLDAGTACSLVLLQVAMGGVSTDSHVTDHVIPELHDAGTLDGVDEWSNIQQQSMRAGSDSGGGGDQNERMKGDVVVGKDPQKILVSGNNNRAAVEHSSVITKTAASKTFSYAQALKTSLGDSSGRTTPCSHTPSDISALPDTRTPTPVSVQASSVLHTSPSDSPKTHGKLVEEKTSQEEDDGWSPTNDHISPVPSLELEDKLHHSDVIPSVEPQEVVVISNEGGDDSGACQVSTCDMVVNEESIGEEDRLVPEDEPTVPSQGDYEGEIDGCGFEQSSQPTTTSTIQPESMQSALINAPHTVISTVLTTTAASLLSFPSSTPQLTYVESNTEHLLQTQVQVSVPTQDHAQLPGKQWTRHVQVPLQVQNQPMMERRVHSGPQQVVHNQQVYQQLGRQGNIQLTQQQQQQQQQHYKQNSPQHVLQQLKQQQNIRNMIHFQQMAQKQHLQQQQQLQHHQKQQLQQQLLQVQRVNQQQRRSYPDPTSLVSVARLPTPRQQLHLLGTRPLMTAPAPQVLPPTQASQLQHHTQNLVVLPTPVQHNVHHHQQQQQQVPQHKVFPMQHSQLEHAKILSDSRTSTTAASLPGSILHPTQSTSTAPQQLVLAGGQHPPTTIPSVPQSSGSPQSVTNSVAGSTVSEDKGGGNGDLKTRLSVTASPFIPGGKTEQPPGNKNRPDKKISPPLIENSNVHSVQPVQPPGFEQITRPFLLQPTMVPGQPHLPLNSAVRPLTTIPPTPLVNHPTLPLSLPPRAPLAATMCVPQSLAKTASLPLHLPTHTTRPAAVQTRQVPFYQYHQPNRGDALLHHNPAHHTKSSLPDSTQSHSLLDQPKLLQMFPPGSAGLIPNPYTPAGMTFVPPIAIATLPLTTPTPTPSPQTLSFSKNGSNTAGLQQKKPLLPTPTAALQTPPITALVGGVSPLSSTTGTQPRLPLRQDQQQQQQLQHSY